MKKAKYEALSFASSSCKAFIEEKQEFDACWHYHPEYELTFILRSKGIRYVGNTIENFEENDLILLGPNVPHCWKNTIRKNLKTRAVVIQWKENLIDTRWAESNELGPICRLFKASGKGLRFDASIALRLKDKLIKLTKLPPFEKLILLLQVLHELSQSSQVHALCESDFIYNLNFTDSERINKVYRYIKDHYQEKITLKSIASHLNMSEAYFSRFFSKMMRKSFFTFLNEYRINIASQLLIETDLQVNQVCYDSGYDSIPFFYRQFRKLRGYSPLAYKMHYQRVNKDSITK